MRLRRFDRYLLRQMVGPFLLALAGLSLFILLNLILRLSELMVDRGVTLLQLLRLLTFWMPELIAWAIPMAALFAVFLGLGRMEHDREIMALESMGVSLRRVLLPLLMAAVGLSFLTFAVYNWAMPASKHAAQNTYREIVFSQSVPRISANTFFTGQSDQYFYVRQYNADTGSMQDVLIYDVGGRLFPQAESRITMVTATSGLWSGDTWQLSSGRMYGFDREGVLVYSGTFDELSIPVAQTAIELWAQSKSPSEMGIRELMERIERARASGLATNESIVELHQRFALPLSALLFVLVGGAVSLMFGSKNRSTGIIIGLLIIGMYQGSYFWMQTLGRRGAMHPVVAAWVPNLLFGLVGLLLFVRVDRLASRDMWNRLRNRLPFLAVLLVIGCLGTTAIAQDTPVHLECDALVISADRSHIQAQGSVRAELEGSELVADALELRRTGESHWALEAAGHVALTFGELRLSGDSVRAEIEVSDAGARAVSLQFVAFSGQSTFENSSGAEHTLYFHGESGRIAFAQDGTADLVEVRDGELTTCHCCDLPFRSQPYTLRAHRLLFYPDRLIVGYGLTGRISGLPILWLPVYVQPLEDTLESPLFPAVGRSALRGWYLKWNVPFYLSESLYGSVLFDYFSRFNELGAGLILRYSSSRQRADVQLYAFPAVVGDREFRLSLDHAITFSEHWTASTVIDYDLKGTASSLGFEVRLAGVLQEWSISSSASRTWKEEGNIVTERLPNVSVSRKPIDLGILAISPSAQAGWVREWREDELTNQATRCQATLAATMQPFRIFGADVKPSFSVGSTVFSGTQDDIRSAMSLAVPLTRGGLSMTYGGTFVAGASPFDFDQVQAQSHIGWSYAITGDMDITVSGGVDLMADSFDLLTASFAWGGSVDWRSTLTYDLSLAAVQEIVLHMNWSSAPHSVSWSLPYNAANRQWDPFTFRMEAKTPSSQLAFSGTVDREGRAIVRGALSVQMASGWGATFQTRYSAADPGRFYDMRYGIFRDIGDCLRIGIERTSGDIWIYGSILAFPEAVLRYAPDSARVQFGD
jgi:LPS export ABC transporter permease LptF